MKKILVVVDMQNDFITGPLGTPEAVAIVDKVVEKIRGEEWDWIIRTMDTHGEEYLETQEGKKLPVEHCIKCTDGWSSNEDIRCAIHESCATKADRDGYCRTTLVEKSTFGSTKLVDTLEKAVHEMAFKTDKMYTVEDILRGDTRNGYGVELTLVGVCTDICVISNALLLKAHYPEMKIVVDASCCAGSTPFRHREAIDIMRSCQVEVVNDINPVEFLEKHFVMPDHSSYY